MTSTPTTGADLPSPVPPTASDPTAPAGRRSRPARARKPYGLGDVAWFALVFLGFQVLLGGLYTAWGTVQVLRGASQGAGAPLDPVAVLEATGEVVTSPAGLVVALVSQWALFLGFPAAVGKVKGFGSLAKDFGLRFRWARDVAATLPLVLVLQGLLLAVSTWLLPAAGVDLAGADNTSMVTSQTGLLLVLMVFSAVVAAPVTEEVLFRGFLLRACMRRWGGWDDYGPDGVPRRTRLGGALVSAVLTAALFGALHVPVGADGSVSVPGALVLVAQTGFLGFVFALLTIRTRRLGPAIAAHCWFNAVSTLLALLSL